MTHEGDKVINSVLKDISFEKFPELSLPPIGGKVALYNAKVEKRIAQAELGIKQIFARKDSGIATWASKELVQHKKDLKKLFIHSNKAIKDNRASTLRFWEIVKEQREFKVKLEREIIFTNVELAEYEKIKETMEAYVERYSIFEHFAESVAGVSNDGHLPTVGDILNRYETLDSTRKHITRILEAEMQVQAELKNQMMEVVEEKSSALKTLNNRLVMLQVSRRQAQDRRRYWENSVQRIKNAILAREEERVVLQGACWDLYKLICNRRKVYPTITPQNINAQLDYIQKSIMFYKDVLIIAAGVKTGGERNNHKSKRVWL